MHYLCIAPGKGTSKCGHWNNAITRYILIIPCEVILSVCVKMQHDMWVLYYHDDGSPFCIAGPLFGESTDRQPPVHCPHTRPVMQSFDILFDVSLMTRQWLGIKQTTSHPGPIVIRPVWAKESRPYNLRECYNTENLFRWDLIHLHLLVCWGWHPSMKCCKNHVLWYFKCILHSYKKQINA